MDYNSKRTKIIATIGPASNSMEMLMQLAVSGVNVFRLNFSHGTHEDHLKVIEMVKDINEKFDYNIAILQDLQGPKIRIGKIEGSGVEIAPGDSLTITTDEVLGNSEVVSTTYKNFPQDVKVNESILVDDGRIRLTVVSVSATEVKTEVVIGGFLRSNKGMNLPDTVISDSCLTAKDLIDLEFGIKHDVNWVAISFVRSHSDIEHLRSIIDDSESDIRIVAKVERPEALDRIDKIIEATDAVMIARGDLGIETSYSKVPIVQKSIIKKCKAAAKPVIVATQMLESMVNNPIPTRAEVTDVASAVMDGVDCVMLSEESAMGKYPIKTVRAMSDIIRSVEVSEEFPYNWSGEIKHDDTQIRYLSRNIMQNAAAIGADVHAKSMVVISQTGYSAFHIARHRPEAQIFVYTNNRKMVNTLNMIWGVKSFYMPKLHTTSVEFLEFAEEDLVRDGFARNGDIYVHVGSIPPTKLGSRMALVGIVGEDS